MSNKKDAWLFHEVTNPIIEVQNAVDHAQVQNIYAKFPSKVPAGGPLLIEDMNKDGSIDWSTYVIDNTIAPKPFFAALFSFWNNTSGNSTGYTSIENYTKHDITEVMMEDTADNQIVEVWAAYKEYAGESSRNWMKAKGVFLQLPLVRNGNEITLDTSALAEKTALSVTFYLVVQDPSKQLTLKSYSFVTADTIRDIVDMDPTQGIDYNYVK